MTNGEKFKEVFGFGADGSRVIAVNATWWDCEFQNRKSVTKKEKEENMSEWIPVTSRPMDEEERAEWSAKIGYDIEYEDAIIYTSTLPDDGQEVLVCNEWGHVWIDTFSNDPDYGVGFEENGDMDGIVAWMPKPKPYKPPKEE